MSPGVRQGMLKSEIMPRDAEIQEGDRSHQYGQTKSNNCEGVIF